MPYLIVAIVLVFCAPAVFVPANRVRMIVITAISAFTLGVLGIAWANSVSPEFLIRHPALLDSPLHPEIANPAGGFFLLFGICLLLALFARAVLIHQGVINRR